MNNENILAQSRIEKMLREIIDGGGGGGGGSSGHGGYTTFYYDSSAYSIDISGGNINYTYDEGSRSMVIS